MIALGLISRAKTAFLMKRREHCIPSDERLIFSFEQL
jgi:hypothetical protein